MTDFSGGYVSTCLYEIQLGTWFNVHDKIIWTVPIVREVLVYPAVGFVVMNNKYARERLHDIFHLV